MLKIDKEVEEDKKNVIPKKSTTWTVKIWKQWSAHRRQTCSSYSEWPTHQMIAQAMELDRWLSTLVLETRKSVSVSAGLFTVMDDTEYYSIVVPCMPLLGPIRWDM